MTENQIVKLNMEARTADLKKEGKSEREIASILTSEAKQTITSSCVHRYFAKQTKEVKQAIELNDKLKVKAAEIQLNTVEERHKVIAKVKALADQAESVGDTKTALYALKTAIAALDSLDERLGEISRAPQVNVQVVNQQVEQRVHEFMNIFLEEVDDATKGRVITKLRQAVIS